MCLIKSEERKLKLFLEGLWTLSWEIKYVSWCANINYCAIIIPLLVLIEQKGIVFFITALVILFPFSLPCYKRGKKKRRMNNQSSVKKMPFCSIPISLCKFKLGFRIRQLLFGGSWSFEYRSTRTKVEYQSTKVSLTLLIIGFWNEGNILSNLCNKEKKIYFCS